MARGKSKGAVSPRTGMVRCAIYTRKSTEEGLDQAFNSLDAQREACAAYILSQRHEGWTMLPDYYDDGGFSGGSMDRPGLRRLLAEVEAGRVDVIVVYKVDRLTRSLADFAKIVDVLDARGASFVSITQAFNTTTSMGRLTLNVLLSFAQFEREVISERVRDKVAASKKKGMWMGGPVPLGYEVVGRKLLVNETEAETVRGIFQRYFEVGTVRLLMDALAAEGVHSKVQRWSSGRTRGGVPFTRGALYHLLQNRLYIGEIVHHDVSYPGEHQGIIERSLWDVVQQSLETNRVERRNGTTASQPSLLAGMLHHHEEGLLTPSHSNKGGRRYRYYNAVGTAGRRPIRLPAADIERAVLEALAGRLSDPTWLADALSGSSADADLDVLLNRWTGEAGRLRDMRSAEQRALLQSLDLRVMISGETLELTIALASLDPKRPPSTSDERVSVPISAAISTRAHEQRLIYRSNDRDVRRDDKLVELIATAHATRRQLIDGTTLPDETGNDAQSRRALMRVARLSYLAPDIVAAILDGTQPPSLNTRRLLRTASIPLRWSEQRAMLGFD